MKATIVDLRYHMNDVLKALDRNEEVQILYHGKLKGVIHPAASSGAAKVQSHAFFGSDKSKRGVQQRMDELRGGRFRGL